MTHSRPQNEEKWANATWEGSRRAQLRDALNRTVRERLERLEMLADTTRHFGILRSEGKTQQRRDSRE